MYGVVLWADPSDSKAVIWCEDHGNLAYYSAAEQPEQNMHQGMALDAGDLIQFDMREDRVCRRARNLRRVDVGFAPTLAEKLQGGGRKGGEDNVVAFPAARRAVG
ncbi:hypothetical protein AVJ23_20675 [Pseudoponticoccus marisrubri]|uniref:Uncharacterized protein n=2 Tax=Pseudoponticoccus marisrubri TaxID=1685382 RepID=A0A0W7WE61_9RHOB|nr:hypothetical protein AVJ23_20675 [Pseudoponticoccus marisrubri]